MLDWKMHSGIREKGPKMKVPPLSAWLTSSLALAALLYAAVDFRRIAPRGGAGEGIALPTSSEVLPYPEPLYLSALEHIERMPRYSTALGARLPSGSRSASLGAAAGPPGPRSWEWLGPGNIGGRTRALVIDPADPRVLFAAGATGGVWKSVDGGALWQPTTDLLPNLTVSSLAMDPRNPNVLYAGTGEASTGFGGDGIFKTIDAGTTWVHLQATGNSDFRFVQRIVVSPNDSRRVYAATDTGVWKSLDGGATWSHTLDPPRDSSPVDYCDLAIRTDRPADILFASFGTTRTEPGSIFRNLDAGSSDDWIAVYSEPQMSRASLAIAPADQDVVYAVAASKEPERFFHGLLAVLKTTDGGNTWVSTVRNTNPTPLNTVLLSNAGGACGSPYLQNQGLYDQTIAVDPTDSDRVWVGGVNLFESLDGGRNWGLNDCCGSSAGGSGQLHPDFHTLVFDPRYDGKAIQALYVGSDGGLTRIDNAESAAPESEICQGIRGDLRWTSLNHHYGVTQFYAGVPYPGGREFLGGTQDNGVVRGTSNGGSENWSMLLFGDGFNVAVDRRNTAHVYAALLGMNILRSIDGGTTWTPASPTLDATDRAANQVPLTVEPDDPSTLWTASRRVWRSSDGGASWSRASAVLRDSSTAPIAATSLPSPDTGAMLVGGSCGEIWMVSNPFDSDESTAPAPAELLAGPGPCAASVTSLTWDPVREGIGYATYARNSVQPAADILLVWKTVDGGASWSPAGGTGDASLPEGIGIYTLWIDPAWTDRVYVGTELGIFVSTDAGRSWAADGDGFPSVRTARLASTADGCTLLAFTHGRGAYRAQLHDGPCRGNPTAAPSGPAPAPTAGRMP
jgi:photosystem II stability/assembly factor-like uncharacterized protein